MSGDGPFVATQAPQKRRQAGVWQGLAARPGVGKVEESTQRTFFGARYSMALSYADRLMDCGGHGQR